MQQLSVYIDDLDAAVLAVTADKQGLSTSALVRTMIRSAVDAAPEAIRTNARAALEQAREDAAGVSVDDLSASGWGG